MNITTRPYQAADALEILKGQAKQPGAALDEMSEKLAVANEDNGPSVTFLADGNVIGCAGLTICWPGMSEAWMLCVKDIYKHPMVARVAKRQLITWADQYNLVRIQAPLRDDFMDGITFANWLGFSCEGRMRKFHPDGCDALLHSIIFER